MKTYKAHISIKVHVIHKTITFGLRKGTNKVKVTPCVNLLSQRYSQVSRAEFNCCKLFVANL